ncbi:MAG TPA: hypothetical protein VGV38_14675 [Pyrinomonadaceae bacterium]|nr:hypothetical protein [Pyrinomonadaceae bacterium]
MENTASAQLRVSHPATKSNQLGRGLKLSLDGEELAHLKVGNSLVVNIEAGRHQLRADNTYHAKTVEFDAEPGRQVHYRISNRVGAIGAVLLGTVGAGPMHIEFERAEPLESSSVPLPRPTSPEQ